MAAENQRKEWQVVSGRWMEVRLPSYHHEVESLFEELIYRTWGRAEWRPNLEVVETAETFVVAVDLPGVEPTAIRLTVAHGRLTIAGERRPGPAAAVGEVRLAERPFGRFARTVEFRVPIAADRVRQQLANGVLTVVVPKAGGGAGA